MRIFRYCILIILSVIVIKAYSTEIKYYKNINIKHGYEIEFSNLIDKKTQFGFYYEVIIDEQNNIRKITLTNHSGKIRELFVYNSENQIKTHTVYNKNQSIKILL